jgi:hypothetical protein
MAIKACLELPFFGFRSSGFFFLAPLLILGFFFLAPLLLGFFFLDYSSWNPFFF